MDHQRKLIRQAVKNVIVAANTAAGSRVFINRMQSLWKVELPCILIYTEQEQSEISIEAPREYLRNLEVNIEVVALADDSLDDTLDSVCAELEQALFADETFGGLVVDTLLTATNMAIFADGEKPIGVTKITLTLPYRSSLPAEPAQVLGALLRTDVQFQDQPAGGQSLSEDLLTLPQGGS